MSGINMEVTAGIGAFLAFFFLAVALWLLMHNMFKRLRRMNLAERDRRNAEAADEDEQSAPGESGGATSRDSGVGDGTEEGQRGGDEV